MEETRLHLFNTLTRQVEEFRPFDEAGKTVGMYCCGPTVYDFGHIGNFRTFVFADLVRRYLEFRGFKVNHVMNITDVEDKIIRRVRETGKTLKEFTATYTDVFLQDLKELNCLVPEEKNLPRATDHIPQIIALIEKLVARGIAYRAADGSVYFSIEKYRGCGCRYGQLVNLNFDAMRVGERVANDEYDKESVADFALWKARVPDDGDVFWPSPWGEGRPGWHIECSAMSMALLGPSFDLHLGGEDLAFPHHEDEIAQSEGAGVQPLGRPFVKHWLHGAHLLVEGKKMSKSLGNYFTVRDLLAKGFTGREIRCLLLSASYRETFNFTLAGLEGARAQLARIDECLIRSADFVAAGPKHEYPPEKVAEYLLRFAALLDDDLNVSRGWAFVFELVHDANSMMAASFAPLQEFERMGVALRLEVLKKVLEVFGIAAKSVDQAPPDIVALANERGAAKKAKDFARADAIRAELKAKGWVVEDTPKGPKLKKL